MNKKSLRIAVASITVIAFTGVASAALICGAVQMHHFGIHDQNFRLAKHWATLPHTVPHVGAVVVQSRRGKDSAGHPGGHVSRIVAMKGNCRAIVADDRGQHERDICSRLIAYVDPNGNRAMAKSDLGGGTGGSKIRIARHQTRTMSAKRHRYAKRSVQTAFVPVDRLTIH